ncbi:MAG: C_GCAxxG_C_C family protein [Chloroflexota bacterium]|nr:MAG: C_GCAxxG_C_C family protein [Chloroflexota bacterium]
MEKRSHQEIYQRLESKVEETLSTCGNCAQTTFLSLQEEFDLEGDEILKALTPFPGIALRGETCGAITGGLMILGLVHGRDKDNLNNWQAYIDSLPPSRRFCRRFENELGSTMCAEIIEDKFGRKFDLADPVEAMEWFQCGALEKCGQVINKGVHLVAEIILEG